MRWIDAVYLCHPVRAGPSWPALAPSHPLRTRFCRSDRSPWPLDTAVQTTTSCRTPKEATTKSFTLFKLAYLEIVLALVIGAWGVRPAAAQSSAPVSSDPVDVVTPQARLTELLRPDGTLDLTTGGRGSVDARGYRLMSGSNGAPSFAPALAPATLGSPGNENWASGFHMAGVNGWVWALEVGPDDSLYVGGNFTVAGNVAANNVARWDGETSLWYALGSGIGNHESMVDDLAVGPGGLLYATYSFGYMGDHTGVDRWDPSTASWQGMTTSWDSFSVLATGQDGSLYVGGYFTDIGGVAANNVARWDGTTWHPLGAGTDWSIWALAVGPDGSLYAGGYFTSAGGVAASGVARWDGTTSSWYALGSGTNGGVRALAVGSDGTLYAGGVFTGAGGVAASRVARWDPATSSWQPMGNGVSNDTGDAYVSALAVGPDGSLYAGGAFTTAGSVSAQNIAVWNPTTSSWHPLGSGAASPVMDLAVEPGGSLYAAAEYTDPARWNPITSSWHEVGSGNGFALETGREVRALVPGPGNALYAGGPFYEAGLAQARSIARWDNATQTWYPLGSGMEAFTGCTVNAFALGADGSLYAGGYFDSAGGVAARNIARWNPTASTWNPLGSGLNGSVEALAMCSSGNLYAGGMFTASGSTAASYIAKWNGSSWSAVGGGMDNVVRALVCSGSNLYAGGEFTKAGGATRSYIARWNGSSWSTLGTGMNGPVYAIVVDSSNNLYAGGDFTAAGTCTTGCNRVAKWNGSTWSALASGLGTGIGSGVRALAMDDGGNLYAAGKFTPADGAAATRIAKWDGSSWAALGSGIEGGDHVGALAVDGSGNLYAGGDFTYAGNQVSHRIARWTAADGRAVSGPGTYTLYANNLPVTVAIPSGGQGDLARINIQRFDKSHANATTAIQTGYYSEIEVLNTSGGAATSHSVHLTLSVSGFAPHEHDQVCRYPGVGTMWDCAASSYTANTITRNDVTQLSAWAVGKDILPAMTPHVIVSLDLVGDPVLTWTHDLANSAGYQVWWSSDPFFVPGDSSSHEVMLTAPTDTYTHVGVPGNNYYYVVSGLNGARQKSGDSNRAGMFGFALVPGTP